MSHKVFDFKKQLSFGKKGEEYLAKLLGMTMLGGKGADLASQLDTGENLLFELKTDSYAHSGNFFWEEYCHYSSHKKAGGPWQAKEKGCAYFLYYFPDIRTLYILDIDLLLARLEEIWEEYSPKKIQNKGWHALGKAIPIYRFDNIILKIQITEGEELCYY